MIHVLRSYGVGLSDILDGARKMITAGLVSGLYRRKAVAVSSVRRMCRGELRTDGRSLCRTYRNLVSGRRVCLLNLVQRSVTSARTMVGGLGKQVGRILSNCSGILRGLGTVPKLDAGAMRSLITRVNLSVDIFPARGRLTS